MQKTSVETGSSQLPSVSCLRSTTNYFRSTNCVRSVDLTDVARLLRKEEGIKKGLRSVLAVNQGLEKAIQAHQATIGDQRAGLTYQLAELLREMKLKFHHFVDERLSSIRMKNMETAKRTLHHMTEHYRQVEEEGSMLSRTLEQMDSIATAYELHSAQLEEEVLGIESANQQHEEIMRTSIAQKAAETAQKVAEGNTSAAHTRQLIAQIDSYAEQTVLLRTGQYQATSKVEKLRRIACSKEEEADALAEWEQYGADWARREKFLRKTGDYESELRRVCERNDSMELWLEELERQQKLLFQSSQSLRGSSKQQKPPR